MSKKTNIHPIFFRNPQKEIAVREFARLQSVSPSTASAYLSDLSRQGILVLRKERNLLLYRAHSDSDIYKDAKRYDTIQRIRNSGLLAYLQSELQQPEAIFLFGSYAKAENTSQSDIDIFIVSRAKKKIHLEAYEKKLHAPIQLFIHAPEEIKEIKKTNPHLLNNVLNGVRLSGFWEVF